jgi:hypothetical protein
VEIAPHDVFFDASRQLWYCDIEINAGASYFPFIRLALAGYQPVSSPGAHLSNVVLADMMALAADRWLNVSPAQELGGLRVAVSGIRVYESSGHHPSLSLTPLGGPVETLVPAQLAPSTVIEIWVEELDERYGEDFGWMPVASATVSGDDPWNAAPGENLVRAKAIGPDFLAQASATDRLVQKSREMARALEPLAHGDQIATLMTPWQTLWEGEVMLPAPSGHRRRLVVAEYEEYLVDDSRPYDNVPTAKGRRMVFVEHVELAGTR